ncbi:hypothetical protein DRI96_01085 [Candidatus Aerophobetes bacterium]|uniref:Uncharacterized protein n=1 Tax=Aerophobetes bacterium TaxID=2030807 RepID=A0A662DIF3_UNCAE|nr:MAG: hypothetical protein DRI96_01085 [Candidatus Aerophobetes bacterium]
MAWIASILVILTVLSLSPKLKQNDPYFKQYFIEKVTVVFTDTKTINTWWRLIGGQKQWQKVHAFTYYDHKKDMYYIVLPPNADNNLIGYEFSHILEWKQNGEINKIRMVAQKSKEKS